MTSNFQPNSSAFREMAVGPEIRAAVEAEAKRAMAIAKGLSEDFTDSGVYLNSFGVTSDTERLTTAFGEHDVAAGTLTNVAYHAAAVEWGNKHDHRAHHVFGRTLAALGGGGGATSLEALGRALGGGHD